MLRKWLPCLGCVGLLAAAAFTVGRSLHFSGGGSLSFPAEIDAGTLVRNKDAEVAIPIVNRSQDTVRLTDFEATCGCMGLYRRTDDGLKRLAEAELGPGQTLDVVLQLRPYELTSSFIHTVMFRTKVPGHEFGFITVRGNVELGMYAVPETIDFGKLLPGSQAERTLYLVDLRQPSDRTLVTLETEYQGACVEGVQRRDMPLDDVPRPHGSGLIQATVKLRAPADGPVRGHVKARTSDGTLWCKVPFYASVTPLVRVLPSVVVLSRTADGNASSARVRCDATIPCTFRFDRLPQELDARLERGFVTVQAKAGARAGSYGLGIHADAEDGRTFSFVVTVTIVDFPRAETPGEQTVGQGSP